MDNFISNMTEIILPALFDTIYMVFWSGLFSILIGLLFGIILYITDKDSIFEHLKLNGFLNIIVNIGRSIPFSILIIAVYPLAKIIIGTAIGREAAVVPLTIAAIPFVARVIDNALKELDKGIIEAATSFGANNFEIIFKVVLPESASSIINAISLTMINLIGYSAMAGMLGAGGLGDVAYRYGFVRYETDILIVTIILIIILVQLVQFTGDKLAKIFSH